MPNQAAEHLLSPQLLGNGLTSGPRSCRHTEMKRPSSRVFSCCLRSPCPPRALGVEGVQERHFQRAKGSALPAEAAKTPLVSGNDALASCVTQVFSFSHRGRVVRERKNIKQFDSLFWILDEQHAESPFCPRPLLCPGHRLFSTRAECGLLLTSRSAVTLSRETGSCARTL